MIYDTLNSSLSASRAQKSDLVEISRSLQVAGNKLATGKMTQAELVQSKSVESLNVLDAKLNLNKSLAQTNSIFTSKLDKVQASLEVIRTTASELSLGVLSELGQGKVGAVASQRAQGDLETIVNSLNITHLGQSLFAGVAHDQQAVKDADTIVTDVKTILESAANPASGLAAVDLYFQDPLGGFQTNIYQGSSGVTQNIEIEQGRFFQFDLQADDDVLKEAIRNVAIVAAVESSTILSNADKKFALESAAEKNFETNTAIVKLQSEIGFAQELVSKSSSKIDADNFVINEIMSNISSVDLFEQASVFEELQGQLQATYQVISRLSSLRLTNFL